MKQIFICLLTAVLLSSCGSVPLTGRKQLLLVSDSEMLSLSLTQYQSYMKSATPSTDKTSAAMVTRVGQNIANAVEKYLKENGFENVIANFAWEFTLVKDNTANAFCMPGGKIVVYEGILPFTKTEAGLATVVAHEVAHAVAKHSSEQVSQQMGISAGSQVVGIAASGQTELAQAVIQSMYGLTSQGLLLLPYSRKMEYEADHLGLIFMAMAGYNPEESITFWERMSSGTSSGSDMLSTHPSDEKRIKQLKGRMPEALKYYTGTKSTTTPTTGKGFKLVY